MIAMIKELIQSRAFWTGLGPMIVAIFNLLGRPLGDEKVQAITAILTIIAGWVGVTWQRHRAGYETSYAETRRVVKEQKSIISSNRKQQGDH